MGHLLLVRGWYGGGRYFPVISVRRCGLNLLDRDVFPGIFS